ncbi:hypothetical protein BGW38_006143 [Lunasporangiospora selenospora]|uniref:Rhodanese domain-containing protein n=1 Tax=Lunasporangiospora selenospora TaxID=979761 RepID=A0A9P6FMZ6_9FUNG|nr:hypothetical protein BGW38_006143 [Lunasporangiospora selenospora]
MATSKQPVYVDSEVLKALIEDKSKVPGKDYLVVDVRDSDYIGGHIPGGINIPAGTLPDQLPQLIVQYGNVPELYFHCALSQVRGPKAARRWSEALAAQEEEAVAAAQEAEKSPVVQKINILRGGFGEWQKKYKSNRNLVEDYDEGFWLEDEY